MALSCRLGIVFYPGLSEFPSFRCNESLTGVPPVSCYFGKIAAINLGPAASPLHASRSLQPVEVV